MAKGKNTVGIVTDIVKPVADEMGLQLWDVRYEKEGAIWYLRLFIDKAGGVNIQDCENYSRAVDKLLDAADPIDGSYTLEVSSPGIERDLVKKEHFDAFVGSPIHVRFIRAVEGGERDFEGTLVSYDNGTVTVELAENEQMEFTMDETAFVRLVDTFEFGGMTENE